MLYRPYPFKRCTQCGEEYPATKKYFNVKARYENNLNSICRKCKGLSTAKWQRDRREIVNARNAKWKREHREQIRIEKIRYRRLNAEKLREARAKYKHEHPEQARKHSADRRARLLNLSATFTSDDWECSLAYFNGSCAYCGHGPTMFDQYWTLQQDHYVPVSRGGGYTLDNILPACESCNHSKGGSEPHEWLVRHFGQRKGAKIERHIRAYFEQLNNR